MAIYSYEYDLSFTPAAPQISIQVRSFGQTDGGVNIDAMVDSGADATMIPYNILKSINAVQAGSGHMLGVTGFRTVVHIYKVTIGIGLLTCPSVLVVAVQEEAEALIGRDVLNQFSVRLDGPAQVVEVSE